MKFSAAKLTGGRRRLRAPSAEARVSAGTTPKLKRVARRSKLYIFPSSQVENRANKWRTAIWLGAIVLLLAGASVAWKLAARMEEPVSLRLKGYHWVARQNLCYAQLELINRTTNRVTFPVYQNDDFGLSPTFSRENRLSPWAPDGIPPSSPASISVVHTLNPGQSVTLKVQVTPGTVKRFVGVLLNDVPVRALSSLEVWLRRALQPASSALGFRLAPPEALPFFDQLIWCDQPMNPPPRLVEQRFAQSSGPTPPGSKS